MIFLLNQKSQIPSSHQVVFLFLSFNYIVKIMFFLHFLYPFEVIALYPGRFP